jgi:hypothetical protein
LGEDTDDDDDDESEEENEDVELQRTLDDKVIETDPSQDPVPAYAELQKERDDNTTRRRNAPEITLESTLRSRQPLSSSEDIQQTQRGTTTSSSLSRPSHQQQTAQSASAVTKLEDQESVQNDLTASLLEMAAALKQSTRSFAATLESEKGTLEKTADGLQRNKDGLDVAGQKMGMLRRMSEGRGWMGRMMIYGYIAGLWIFAILLVFGLPKLRF